MARSPTSGERDRTRWSQAGWSCGGAWWGHCPTWGTTDVLQGVLQRGALVRVMGTAQPPPGLGLIL